MLSQFLAGGAKLLPAEVSHRLAPWALEAYSLFQRDLNLQWQSRNWKGLHFQHPLGVAGGVDKNGDSLQAWQKVGAAFIEVGTITPQAQGPNPGRILSRSVQDQALWNKMGFPNDGVAELFQNLKDFEEKKRIPVFASLGRNRWTSIQKAHDEIFFLAKKLSPHADAFVINVSSPNTTGQRDLQQSQNLKNLLKAGKSADPDRPFLVKLSPDLSEFQLREAIDVAINGGCSGFVLTNTTTQRWTGCPFPAEGGVSGRPLLHLSEQSLKIASNHLGHQKSNFLLISVGGIFTCDDILKRMELGADLVQVYSALVFEGFGFFKSRIRELQLRQEQS